MKELIFRTSTSLFFLLVLIFSYIYSQLFFILLISILLLSFYEFKQIIFKIKKLNDRKFLTLLIGLIYIFLIFFYIFDSFSDNKNIIFYFIIICVATDIGGFVFGKIFKGKKLTKISPNKTYSGFYGSFFLSFIFMMIFLDYLNINFLIISIFTFSVCLLSQLGDIFFSYLKRLAKIKNTGTLLPGHGGILDRIDGIIISVPINFLIYSISL